MIKGFKVFNEDWTCRGFQYEVGQTYEHKGSPVICNKGFHFCKEPKDCFNYYSFDPKNKVAEVIAHGEISEEGDKCSTNKIEIVREIPWIELLTLVNLGKENTGLGNTGYSNTGNRNTGDRNTGYSNTGDRNTGYSNTGYSNTGYSNTGDRNTGNRNTGNGNQGDNCTGDFNISDHETGCFCTDEHKIRIFDVETDMTFRQWRNSDAYLILRRIEFKPNEWISSYSMSEDEKKKYPEHETTGGYLKVCDTDKTFINWWNELDDIEKETIKGIQNFNAEKFKLITGIEV